MPKTVNITIVATGEPGSGKTRAINAMLKAVAQNPEFKVIDSRFYVYPNEEQQTIELVLT